MTFSIFMILFFPTAGALADYFGLPITFLAFGVVLTVVMAVFGGLLTKRKETQADV